MIIGRLSPEDQYKLARKLLLASGYTAFGTQADSKEPVQFTRFSTHENKWVQFIFRPEILKVEYLLADSETESGRALGFTDIQLFSSDLSLPKFREVSAGLINDLSLCEGFKYPPSLRIEMLSLDDYRGFRKANIVFSDSASTIFIGNNGSGKSSILDALATSLSWLSRRISDEQSRGYKPSQDDINNDGSYAVLVPRVRYYGRSTEWTIVEKRKGHPSSQPPNYVELNKIIRAQQREFASKDIPINLPVLVYYPVNRIFLDVPKRVKKKHNFEPLETYDDALVAGGRDFRLFFEWFRERENLENELIRDQKDYLDRELQAIKKAVRNFTGLEDLRIRRFPKQRMMAVKDGKKLSVQQLSDGEKCLLALAGDLARRLALANPEMEDPLEGCGVVLIDEIELHLHPGWQRQIVQKLEATFPNCQFILTTHSPIVLSQVSRESIRILENFEVIENQAPVEGREVNSILADVMDVPIFPDQTRDALDQVEELVEKEDYTEARKRLEKLAEKLGELDPTIVHHRSTIDFLEEDLFED